MCCTCYVCDALRVCCVLCMLHEDYVLCVLCGCCLRITCCVCLQAAEEREEEAVLSGADDADDPFKYIPDPDKLAARYSHLVL